STVSASILECILSYSPTSQQQPLLTQRGPRFSTGTSITDREERSTVETVGHEELSILYLH
ncbi:40559_t:CDS:1, partial [Gigaspora margarita]